MLIVTGVGSWHRGPIYISTYDGQVISSETKIYYHDYNVWLQITYFRVSDRLGVGRPPAVQITRGGLQKKYITLLLTSSYNTPIAVNIYIGCENKLTTSTSTTPETDTKDKSNAEEVEVTTVTGKGDGDGDDESEGETSTVGEAEGGDKGGGKSEGKGDAEAVDKEKGGGEGEGNTAAELARRGQK